MNLSVFASIFYVISLILVIVSVYRVKKGDHELYGAVWLPVSAIAVTGYQILVAGIINVIHIPVNIISIGLFDLIAAIILLIYENKKKAIQKYKYELVDIVFWGILVIVCVIFMLQRYGTGLDIHYMSIDPTAHIKAAVDVINNQKISQMYYASFHNALLIETLGIYTGETGFFHIYLIGEVLHLLLTGLTFYAVIRGFFKDSFMKIAGVIISIVYLLGFPLSSTIFGFTYLGMGVTVIAYLLVVTDAYLNSIVSKRLGILLIMLGCLAIINTYILFMPVAFFSILICCLVNQYKKKRLFSMSTIYMGLGCFLIPCVIGLGYTYFGIFGGSTTVGSAISTEGGIYRDLYSNFVFLFPMAVFAVVMIIKNKVKSVLPCYLILLTVFIAALFVLGMCGKVSSYYYYKNYFVLSLITFVLSYIGLYYLEKNARIALSLVFCVWCGILLVNVFNIEGKIAAKNSLYIPYTQSTAFCNVYALNREYLLQPKYNVDKIEIFQYAYDKYLEGTQEIVPIAASWEDVYWMEAITGQRVPDYHYWGEGTDAFFENMKRDNVEYIIVFTDSQMYEEFKYVFDSYTKVYENGAGFIGRIN